MRVISAVQLVVLAFVAALLITALLHPHRGAPEESGIAGASPPRSPRSSASSSWGWSAGSWSVQENIDNLSNQIQDGIDELRKWLLNSPFHVTDKQINEIAKNLRDAIGANTDQIASASRA